MVKHRRRRTRVIAQHQFLHLSGHCSCAVAWLGLFGAGVPFGRFLTFWMSRNTADRRSLTHTATSVSTGTPY